MAHGAGHAAGLMVNTFTLKTGEATDAWLLRNDFAPSLRTDLLRSLLAECELQLSQRAEHARSMVFSFLAIHLPMRMDLPSRLVEGLECSH